MPVHPSGSAKNTLAFGLLKPRSCVLPTWRGWLLLLMLGLVAVIAVLKSIHPFLAINDPRPGDALVVEGWVADYVLEQTIWEYERGGYRTLYVTGGPLDKGAPLVEYRTMAELGLATIYKMRPDLKGVHAVPAPFVMTDRTYASAVALKRWLREQGKSATKLNLVSGGTHSRRSRMLFQEAFGPETEIGILAMEDLTYDPKRWWASSQGFRSVTNEAIAYVYARFFFRPPTAPESP